MTDVKLPQARPDVPSIATGGTAPDLVAIRARAIAAIEYLEAAAAVAANRSGPMHDPQNKPAWGHAETVRALLAEVERLNDERDNAATGDAQWNAAIEAGQKAMCSYCREGIPYDDAAGMHRENMHGVGHDLLYHCHANPLRTLLKGPG